ncbi:hypothetical protein Tco_0605825 [Tanacetum coccineum]
MRTRSSSNLVGESSPNPTTSNPKRRNRRRSKQPFSLEESPLDTMADQRTMAELLRAPTEGYAEAIVIYPRLLNQDFVEPPSEDELIPFIHELGYSGKCASQGKQQDLIDSENDELKSCGMINQHIKDSKAYKTYLDFSTGKATPKKARKFNKVASPSRKLSPVLEEEPAEKPKRAKKPAKKSTIVPTAGVVIRDTPSEPVSRKLSRKASWKLISFMHSQPKVLDEQEDKKTSTDKGTSTKPEDDDDDVDSDADGDKEASNSEKTDSDKDENPNLNQNDNEEEEHEEEYVHIPGIIKFTDDDEEYRELYKDVNVRLQATEHGEEGKRDEEMPDAGRDEGTQQTTYEQVKDDEHSFLNLDNVPPTDTKVVSMMNVTVHHEEPSTQTPPLLNIPITVTSETLSAVGSTIPSKIPPISSLQQQSTPTPTPAPTTSTTSPAMVDAQLSTRLEDSIKKSFRSYIAEFEKKAKDERKRYIDLVEKSVKEIIKDEVKSQLPAILPKEVSDYATLVIQSTITESLKNIVLAKSSSQPKSTYKAAASLTEFELKKILLDKI